MNKIGKKTWAIVSVISLILISGLIFTYYKVPAVRGTILTDKCGIEWNSMENSCSTDDDCISLFEGIADTDSLDLRCEDNICEIKMFNCGGISE